MLEEQSQAGVIDLFYGDESSVSEEGYVPYGWQFKDESVCIEVVKGQRLNRTGGPVFWANLTPESVALCHHLWFHHSCFCGQ